MTRDSHELTELATDAHDLSVLRSSARDMLDREWDSSSLRDLLDGDPPGWSPDLWKLVTDLGWPDTLVSAEDGGGGGNIAQLCAIAEEVGAALAPLPLVTAAVAAALTGSPTTDGELRVLAHAAEIEPDTVGDEHPFVAYGDVADRMLVPTRRGDRPVIVDVDLTGAGVTREALRPLDAMPAAAVDLTGAEAAPVVAEGDDAVARWRWGRLCWTLGITAELTGVAATANSRATAYAGERVAFGRPIGSFQAIKHRLVDQRTAVEVSRALVARGCDAVAEASDEAEALVSLAAFWAVTELRQVAEGSVQVFGGIGYTWEHDAHLALRRAAVLTALLGTRRDHRSIVGRWIDER